MTDLLETVVATAGAFPPDAQDEMVRVLLAWPVMSSLPTS